MYLTQWAGQLVLICFSLVQLATRLFVWFQAQSDGCCYQQVLNGEQAYPRGRALLPGKVLAYVALIAWLAARQLFACSTFQRSILASVPYPGG